MWLRFLLLAMALVLLLAPGPAVATVPILIGPSNEVETLDAARPSPQTPADEISPALLGETTRLVEEIVDPVGPTIEGALAAINDAAALVAKNVDLNPVEPGGGGPGFIEKVDIPLVESDEEELGTAPEPVRAGHEEARATCDCVTDPVPDATPMQSTSAATAAKADAEADEAGPRMESSLPDAPHQLMGETGPTIRPTPLASIVLPAALAFAGLAASARLLSAGPGALSRRLLARLGVAGLFTRIATHALLLHPRRQALHDWIQANPGERLAETGKALRMPPGTLRHHLRMLEGAGLVRLEKTGAFMRIFPRGGPAITPAPYLTRWPKALMQLVGEQPGLVQDEIAQRLGLSKRAVSYHVATLRSSSRLRVVRDGRFSRCYPGADSA